LTINDNINSNSKVTFISIREIGGNTRIGGTERWATDVGDSKLFSCILAARNDANLMLEDTNYEESVLLRAL
jgi:hypothetical protein